MHHVAPSETLPERSPRAPLKHPIRVTIAGSRVVRVLSGDISPNGMFLQMPEPPERGTVVTMAFEAGGKVLPFAEGEVAWGRGGTHGGFGVRFTHYLHPNARALVDYLSENVTHGTAIKPPPPVKTTRRWKVLGAAAAIAGCLITWSQLPSHEPLPQSDGGFCTDTSRSLQGGERVGVRGEPEPTATLAPKPVPEAPKKRVQSRLAESPRATPVLARTLGSAVKPAPFTSTPIPSGAARLINVSRVSGSLRLAVDTVATGHVTSVHTLQRPARLVIDVAGLPPVSDHVLPLEDPELRQLTVTKQGAGTRLVFELVRLPTRVAQQGDSALLGF